MEAALAVCGAVWRCVWKVRLRPPGPAQRPQEVTPTHQHPVGGAGGATASNGVSGTGVLAAQRRGGLGGVYPPQRAPAGQAGAAGALHGPRRHLRGSGGLRGRSGGVFGRPQDPHCAVTTPWQLVFLYGTPHIRGLRKYSHVEIAYLERWWHEQSWVAMRMPEEREQ